MRYAKPSSLNDALALLAEGQWSVLAGGTDFYPALRDRPVKHDVLDIWQLDLLRQIHTTRNALRVGALVTWTDLLRHPLPGAFDSLKLAAREIGSVQIQNRATLVGNLCNASPAADGVPPLLTLCAEVELQSVRGTRLMPLASFIEGNRRTDRQPDELVTAIVIPESALAGVSSFSKLGFRKYLVISVSMVAVRLVAGANQRVSEAFVAVGACSEVAQRLPGLEASILDWPLDQPWRQPSAATHLDTLAPIDDIRASRRYRLDATRVLIANTIEQARSRLQ